jgi:hypothetical protein
LRAVPQLAHDLLPHLLLRSQVLLELIWREDPLQLRLLVLVRLPELAHLDQRTRRSLDDRVELLGVLEVQGCHLGQLRIGQAELRLLRTEIGNPRTWYTSSTRPEPIFAESTSVPRDSAPSRAAR